ncbi:hypothetical protein PV326_008905 [Microctonus aethiopoides]|nr:hypothetical protein PV326_008905 [Microctonus aethiopoides]
MRIDNPFAKFYGFKKDEVKDLLKVANKANHFDLVKSKYSGYRAKSSDGHNIDIYSPRAVMQYILSGNCDDDWTTGICSEIFKVMSRLRIVQKISRQILSELKPQYKAHYALI